MRLSSLQRRAEVSAKALNNRRPEYRGQGPLRANDRRRGAERGCGDIHGRPSMQDMLLSVGALLCAAHRTARGHFRRNECAELEGKECPECWILA